MKQPQRPTTILLAFILVNLAWRALFLPVCQSSYTDGILQIDMFRLGVSYWPPLYAVLARLPAWIPGLGLEGAARLVSIVCGVAVLWPLFEMGRRLFGLRAAAWAMAAWTATPLAHQWTLQVMTDMPFAFFWMASLLALLRALENYYPDSFPQSGAVPSGSGTVPSESGTVPSEARGLSPIGLSPLRGARWLLAASALGAAATLTRYQGILLIPVLLVAVWRVARSLRSHAGPRGMNPWLTLLPWLVVPVWLGIGAASLARHSAQIGARMGESPWRSLVNYYSLFEEFVLKSPYFLTYGIFGFMLYGLFRTQWSTARLRWTGWASLWLTVTLLAMQSVFSSWQARYMLPLVPLACLFAGHGLAVWERHCEGRRLRLWGLVIPALGWGLIFSALVAVFQGSPFKDIKEAAAFVKGLKPGPGQRLWSNETYSDLGSVKVSFWAGRPADEMWLKPPPPKPGDLVVITSYNALSLSNYQHLHDDLIRNMPCQELASYGRYALPLITDIMQEGGTAQNPLAWQFRYSPQYFETSVLKILKRPEDAATSTTQPGSEPLKPIPPLPTLSGDLQKLRDIQQQIQSLKK